MPSSISSSERLTAADRPGVAQPVPERPVPPQPWGGILAAVLVLLALAITAWEWRMRSLQLLPGDFDDVPSAWAEQRRRIDREPVAVAILGDSRILFDTDLDRFEALTGVRPVQLALAGTNARPFLAELAADADFRGLAIVGIAERSYFRDEAGRSGKALDRYRFESPSDRSGYVLQRWLERHLGFLDDNYRLSKLVQRRDQNRRAPAPSPATEVWKLRAGREDRQTWLWERLQHDQRLRAQARGWVGRLRAQAAVASAPDVVARTQAITRDAVAQIRARGGDVIFVRPPSSNEVRTMEEQQLPRAAIWDALLAAAGVRGIHFEDYVAMQGLDLPEWSHLSRRCATVFTDAYVRELVKVTPRLQLLPDAPAALSPADCVSQGTETGGT